MEKIKDILHRCIDKHGIDSCETLIVSKYLDLIISEFQKICIMII